MDRAIVFAVRGLGWLVMSVIGAIWQAMAWLLDAIAELFRR